MALFFSFIFNDARSKVFSTNCKFILWKDNLNSNCTQFHRYQQNEQSPLILTHWTQRKTTWYNVGNPCSFFRQAHKCTGVVLITTTHYHFGTICVLKAFFKTFTRNCIDMWEHEIQSKHKELHHCLLSFVISVTIRIL